MDHNNTQTSLHIVHSFSPPLFNPLSCFPLPESSTWMCNSVPGCLATSSGVPEPRDPLVKSRRNVTLTSSSSDRSMMPTGVLFLFVADMYVYVIYQHFGQLFVEWSSVQVLDRSRWQTLIICFAQSGHALLEFIIMRRGKNIVCFQSHVAYGSLMWLSPVNICLY